MTTRLAQIAAHAGVSEATVSRVLNDRPGVADATRAAVLTAVDVLGYQRPSNLRHQVVGLIGLLVPELTNPVFPLFAQTIQMRLAAEGYTAVLGTQAPGGLQEDDYVSMLLDRGVAGIIFVSGLHADTSQPPTRYTELRRRGLPMVLVNGHRDDVDAPTLSTDETVAVSLAVDHLRQLGHTRIGLATGQSRYLPSHRKVQAFRTLVGPRDGVVQQTWFTVEGGVIAGQHLLDAGCTAVVCGSDMMALGVIRAGRQRGLHVPDELSVVGYDGSPITQYTSPPLTTVRQNVAELSSGSVRALLDEVGGHPHPRGEVLFSPELVVRGSSAPAPTRADPRRGAAPAAS